MKALKRSMIAVTALGVGMAFATPGMTQAPDQPPPPAEQLASPQFTDDMQTAIRSYFQSEEPAVMDPAPDGQAVVGQAAPAGVTPQPLPPTLAADLPPGQFGYYAVADEIVVVDLGDQRVVARIPRG